MYLQSVGWLRVRRARRIEEAVNQGLDDADPLAWWTADTADYAGLVDSLAAGATDAMVVSWEVADGPE